jgi:hypothetical protein
VDVGDAELASGEGVGVPVSVGVAVTEGVALSEGVAV